MGEGSEGEAQALLAFAHKEHQPDEAEQSECAKLNAERGNVGPPERLTIKPEAADDGCSRYVNVDSVLVLF